MTKFVKNFKNGLIQNFSKFWEIKIYLTHKDSKSDKN